MLLILMSLTLAKIAKADPDCSKIKNYSLAILDYSNIIPQDEKNLEVRFFTDAASQDINVNTKCIKLKEIQFRHRYAIEGSFKCGAISYMVNHYDENNQLLKQEFAVVPYEFISRRDRVDDKIYTAGQIFGEAMDLVGPAVAIVAGPVVGIGDSIADLAINAEGRTEENIRAAQNNVLRFLDSDKSLKLCQ